MKWTLYKVIRSGCTSTPEELSSFSLSSTSSGVSWTNTDESGFNLTIELTAHTPNDDPNDNANGTCNTASALQDEYDDKYFKLTFTGENIQCNSNSTDPITIKFLAHSTYHTGNIASAIGDCLIGFPSSTDAFWESLEAQDSIFHNNANYPTSTATFSSDLLLNIGMVFSQQFEVTAGSGNCTELKIDANDDDIDNGNIEVEFTVPGVSFSTNHFVYDPDMVVKEGQLMGGFPILAAILILVVLICCCFGCCAYYCCCRKKKGGRKGAVAPKPTNLS